MGFREDFNCTFQEINSKSTVRLEKLLFAQLVKKLSVVCGTQRSIATFTRASSWTMNCAK
jgi:hypothetical protein